MKSKRGGRICWPNSDGRDLADVAVASSRAGRFKNARLDVAWRRRQVAETGEKETGEQETGEKETGVRRRRHAAYGPRGRAYGEERDMGGEGCCGSLAEGVR